MNTLALIAALTAPLPDCAFDAALDPTVHYCKMRLEPGDAAPYSGVLLSDGLSLRIARDIATLEAAVVERDKLVTAARAERDDYIDLYSSAIEAGDDLDRELRAERSKINMSLPVGFALIAIGFAGGVWLGVSL